MTFNPLKLLAGSKSTKTTEVAIEYYAPHWIIVIRNPGQKSWAALRSKTKFIRTYDEFGEEVSKRPAIESFKNMTEALDWVRDNMPTIAPIARSAAEMEDFGRKLRGESGGTLIHMRDPHASKPYATVS
jgi:hypothetical protein